MISATRHYHQGGQGDDVIKEDSSGSPPSARVDACFKSKDYEEGRKAYRTQTGFHRT
jgi:hypothetical protein